MLLFGVFPLLLAVASADQCYNIMNKKCDVTPSEGTEDDILSKCSAVYAGIDTHQAKLQSFAIANIESSFEYLLMSTFMGNYETNRDGFKKLFRKYSDQLWEDGINVMKYIAKRGGEMNFKQPSHENTENIEELSEPLSLAKAVDIQKHLAKQAIDIYSSAQSQTAYHDPAIAHYIEEKFVEPHSDRIRELAGYITELKNLKFNKDSVGVFLFDDFLQKTV